MTRIAETATQLGVGIRRLRKERKWKQAVLAEATGLSVPTISLIETSKTNPSYYDLEKIAQALETSIPGLLAAGRKSFRDTDTKLKVLVASNMVTRRTYLGITRTELANSVGLLPQYISTTENARRLPGLVNFLHIARGLSIPPDHLLSGHLATGYIDRVVKETINPMLVLERLNAARHDLGLTNVQVSRRTGIGAVHLSKLESGKHFPNLKTILAYCSGLNLSLAELFEVY